MAHRSLSLDQVRIADPCPENWADMTGDDRERFCRHCNKHVHDISKMSQDEFDALVCQNAGRLCVRHAVSEIANPDKTTLKPISLPYAPASETRRFHWRRFIPVFFLSLIAAGSASFSRKPTAVPPRFVMGLIVAPTIQPPTPTSTATPTNMP